VCTSCGTALEGKFAQVGGKPYCPNCSRKALPKATPTPPTPAKFKTLPASGSSGSGSKTGTTPAGSTQTGMLGLFQWAKNRTDPYGIEIKNWTKSWEDGYAYCALLHSYHPELIDFASLKPGDRTKNLKIAYQVAKQVGIVELLDEEDFGLEKLSMMTQMSETYKHFQK